MRHAPALRTKGRIACRIPQCASESVSPHMQHQLGCGRASGCHRKKVEYLLRLWAHSSERLQHHRAPLALVALPLPISAQAVTLCALVSPERALAHPHQPIVCTAAPESSLPGLSLLPSPFARPRSSTTSGVGLFLSTCAHAASASSSASPLLLSADASVPGQLCRSVRGVACSPWVVHIATPSHPRTSGGHMVCQ